MQRHKAKNRLVRLLLSAETGNVENRRQDPRRNGLFAIDDSFRSSGRLDGGVRSRIRTRLSGDSTLEQGKFANPGLFCRAQADVTPVFMGLSDENSRASLTGIFAPITGKSFAVTRS